MNIAYIGGEVLNEPGRTQYQRPKYFSQRHTLFFLTREECEIPSEIANQAHIVRMNSFLPYFMRLPVFMVWAVIKVLYLHREHKIDVVYTIYYTPLVGYLLKRFFGFCWVADVWDDPGLGLEIAKQKPHYYWTISYWRSLMVYTTARHTLKNADLVVCVGVDVERYYGVNSEKILELTNGVDLTLVQSLPQKVSKTKPDFIVAYVGFVSPARGAYVLVEAIKQLIDSIANMKLVMIGPIVPEEMDNVARIEQDMDSCIEFTGRIKHEEVLQWLQKADVCVYPFPRKKELDNIYPIKVFEYMAMEKAIVATALKGVSAIIQDGQNGLLVEPDCPTEMATAIRRIYDDPELKEKLEKLAQQTVKQYDWNSINGTIIAKLEELIHKPLREKEVCI